MSLTEELLGYVDLVMLMLVAQDAHQRQPQDQLLAARYAKLKSQVESVSREIHKDHRGVEYGNGKQGRLL